MSEIGLEKGGKNVIFLLMLRLCVPDAKCSNIKIARRLRV
jgi:hypothetical protein